MTLDDETADRIILKAGGDSVIASIADYERALVRAGYAHRDAHVKELVTRLENWSRSAGEQEERVVRAEAKVEELRAELDILRATEDGNLSEMRERAERAEATLVKVWGYVKEDPAFEPENEYARGVMGACAAIRRLLNEPPTEREMSTAERWQKFYALIERLRTKYGVEADR